MISVWAVYATLKPGSMTSGISPAKVNFKLYNSHMCNSDMRGSHVPWISEFDYDKRKK